MSVDRSRAWIGHERESVTNHVILVGAIVVHSTCSALAATIGFNLRFQLNGVENHCHETS
jgi:hypothetical protein